MTAQSKKPTQKRLHYCVLSQPKWAQNPQNAPTKRPRTPKGSYFKANTIARVENGPENAQARCNTKLLGKYPMKEEFDQLCSAGETSGPCAEEQIADAELELKVQFPSQYRSFLSEYGAVVANGVELFGLPNIGTDEMPLWQDVVKVKKQLADWGQAGSENPSFVPITEDGTGVYFYLDASSALDTKIIAVGAGIAKTVSSDLFEFAVQMSKGEGAI